MRNGVDIVIPIYNAFDDLQKCLESVEKYTDLSHDRLILINDNSSDERILPLLRSKESKNVIVVNNAENKGFSCNVNIGMSISDSRDVLLLNSDTVVTRSWIDKIHACAYSALEIGTVTPLSNAATLCSVPVMCMDNKLPDWLSADDMAEIVEKCSIRAYPRITVAVGFCMFIKREVINAAGLFDADTFGKGYGEENDFCNRAEQLGYIHVMCDDTFIYHRGTASFKSGQKKKLCEEHEKILDGWYPAQMWTNSLYCMKNPEQYIRSNIQVFIDLKQADMRNGHRRILYLSHRDFRNDAYDSVGGTQFHIRDLTEAIEKNYTVFVVSRDRDYLRLTIYIGEKHHSYRFYIGAPNLFFQFRNKALYDIFSLILDAFEIDMVHVHHVESLSLDMYHAAHERNIPILQTVHDYFSISISISISPQTVLEKEFAEAKRKLRDELGYRDAVEILPVWHRNWREVFCFCDRIVFPSLSARNAFLDYFPEIEPKSLVIAHGADMPSGSSGKLYVLKSEVRESSSAVIQIDRCDVLDGSLVLIDGWAYLAGTPCGDIEVFAACENGRDRLLLVKTLCSSRPDVADAFQSQDYLMSGFHVKFDIGEECEAGTGIVIRHGGAYYTNPQKKILLKPRLQQATAKRKIAFVGGITKVKGSDCIYEVMRDHLGDDYEWYLVGLVGDERVARLENGNLHKVGFYAPSELPRIISALHIDVVCILSTWAETFCYTLSESIMSGVPVLGTSLGAVGERIRMNGYGWILPFPFTGKSLVEKLHDIFADEAGFQEVRNRAMGFREKSVSEMCGEYGRLYEETLCRGFAKSYGVPDYKQVLAGLLDDGDRDFVYKERRGSFLNFDEYIKAREFFDREGLSELLAWKHEVEVQIKGLEVAIEGLKRKKNELLRSSSWKVAKPVRMAGTLIRKHKK